MKYMTMRNKNYAFDLQQFAGEGEGDGADTGEGDDQDENSDEDGEEDQEEKKYSQKDMDDAVKKRLARERKKWQKQQEAGKPKLDGKEGEGDGGAAESEDTKARKAAESRASKMEVKIACFEADVAKDSVDDVAALAKAYMEADEDLDLEEAIEKVVKKYPHFKKGTADQDEEGKEETRNKSWGQRQLGKGAQKRDGVEDAFLKKNPGLKID